MNKEQIKEYVKKLGGHMTSGIDNKIYFDKFEKTTYSSQILEEREELKASKPSLELKAMLKKIQDRFKDEKFILSCGARGWYIAWITQENKEMYNQ